MVIRFNYRETITWDRRSETYVHQKLTSLLQTTLSIFLLVLESPMRPLVGPSKLTSRWRQVIERILIRAIREIPKTQGRWINFTSILMTPKHNSKITNKGPWNWNMRREIGEILPQISSRWIADTQISYKPRLKGKETFCVEEQRTAELISLPQKHPGEGRSLWSCAK